MTRACLPARRRVLGALAIAATLPAATVHGQPRAPLLRAIPSTGERVPAVGLGTWITFNVGNDRAARDACAEVVRAFHRAGGRVIDASPMYGSSQAVTGEALVKLSLARDVFSADKVWTGAGSRGRDQIEESRRRWQVARFDLVQVHNLLAWQEHLPTLFDMKRAGTIRYVGITTSEGRRHGEFEKIMRAHPLDFVQLTYNPLDREVESRLLPLAQERGIAVLVNRPFRQKALLEPLARRPLPGFAAELRCTSWAQLVLKFVLAHPAVTCVIPATTQPAHARENVAAASDPLPDAALRKRIVSAIAAA